MEALGRYLGVELREGWRLKGDMRRNKASPPLQSFGKACDCVCSSGLTITPRLSQRFNISPPVSRYFTRMRRFAYCKVVLATSLVWVMLDMFILLYFSECNKCDEKKERGLPGREGECIFPHTYMRSQRHTLTSSSIHSCVCVSAADSLARPRDGPGEGGKPVVIPKENQEKMKEMFKINQFNLMASEMIALNRTLPDVRLEG